MSEKFQGSKVAVVHEGRVLVPLRDDFTHIPFPAHWDFAGGGRESDETPEHCALRELHEEFGLRLASERIVWRKLYADTEEDGAVSYFIVALADARDLDLRLGDEGQCWDWMPVETFFVASKGGAALAGEVERLPTRSAEIGFGAASITSAGKISARRSERLFHRRLAAQSVRYRTDYLRATAPDRRRR